MILEHEKLQQKDVYHLWFEAFSKLQQPYLQLKETT